ncbi:MAG: hypothetical protein JRK53_02935 [Deltaproteobacteria bacterium]|nr:hypothetical protein [Deltaproteobacteria bacterium]MBW1817030.1 hypothetical protein [Deltaproteobacteria bacterium]
MTPASQQALVNLRDLSTLQWYVIPLLAIVFYIYAVEIKKARLSGNWDAIYCGLTVLGMDFINETWNGWVFHLTQRSAFWTTPGPTALRTMMGWNIEIMFMFAISGLIFYYTLSEDRREKILGIPNRWFWAIGYSVFCVLVECMLNLGGHLVWEYPWWNLSFGGVWLIFFFGYFHFYVAAILVLAMKTPRAKAMTIASLYGIAAAANIVAGGVLGWVY